ncbi:hypothetical protein GFM07_39380 [Rhizobium leguminosarum bv. viciae]|nr:hypothetical protein [Rhizobium leguminosarum bv. viciae]
MIATMRSNSKVTDYVGKATVGSSRKACSRRCCVSYLSSADGERPRIQKFLVAILQAPPHQLRCLWSRFHELRRRSAMPDRNNGLTIQQRIGSPVAWRTGPARNRVRCLCSSRYGGRLRQWCYRH